MDEALYACRFVQFTAAMVIFGAVAFRFYAVPGGDARAWPSVLAGFEAWLGRMTLATADVVLISALALLLCQAAAMAGSPAAATDPVTVTAVLFETRFGRLWCWHLLLGIFLVLACLGWPRRRQPVVLILSPLLLASLGWTCRHERGLRPDRPRTQSDRASVCRRAVARRVGAVGMFLRRA
jgi:copper resistance protein D